MTAERYIASLRSAAKRQYARAYLRHIQRPNSAPPDWAPLSYMAAQAVRFNIHDALKGGGR